MDPRTFVAAVNALHQAAAALAAMDSADLPASLAAAAVPTLHHAVALADNALAVVTRKVEIAGAWAEDGSRSPAAWVASVTGASHGQACARLAAARTVEDHRAFADGFRTGTTTVAHLAAVARTLSGPGVLKAARRRAFPAFADVLAQTAAASDPATFARVLREWTEAVDHHPGGPDADARTHRHLVFTELGDTCLLEASMPLPEGRLLRRRLEAVLDAHHRKPEASPLREVHRRGGDPGARGDEDLDVPAGERFTPRAALLLDALLALTDLADAHPGAVPIVDGTPPQVLVIVPAARLADRKRPGWPAAAPTGTAPRGTASPGTASPGTAPPGTAPPGTAPPGTAPPGTAPPGTAPPGTAPPTSLPPPALLGTGADLSPVDDATARWASCGDAEIRRLVLDPAGIVTDLGRSTRIAGRDLRLRAALRDRYCRHPGCRVPATRCQLHHLTHWADGGHTRLDQMYCCCPTHHRWYHQQESQGLIRVTGSPDTALDFWNGAVHLGTTRPQPLHWCPPTPTH